MYPARDLSPPVAEPITLPSKEDLAYIRKHHLKPYERPRPIPPTIYFSYYLAESDYAVPNL